jgi:hypothetical protein
VACTAASSSIASTYSAFWTVRKKTKQKKKKKQGKNKNKKKGDTKKQKQGLASNREEE